MSLTFAGKAGSRMRERTKSSRSFIPCAAGIATTSYLSKAARIVGMAGSGVGSEAVGFVCCVLLAACGAANRNNNTIQAERAGERGRNRSKRSFIVGVRYIGMRLSGQFVIFTTRCVDVDCSNHAIALIEGYECNGDFSPTVAVDTSSASS